MATQRRLQRRRAATSSGGPGFVRIIGGAWRGRRLPVADAPDLRPSGNRVRETLFNWLQPHIQGARCADSFAGTGALGFEAASRGARSVTLIERSAPLAARLRESAGTLGAEQVEVVHADGLEWLRGRPPHSLDIVFLDPPFASNIAQRALEALRESRGLAPGGLLYLESPRIEPPAVPADLVQTREKLIGEVRMQLFERPAEA